MEDNKEPGSGAKLKSFVMQCVRVWKLLKKPDKTEFTTIAKVSAIGLGVIGVLGFVIAMAMKFVKF